MQLRRILSFAFLLALVAPATAPVAHAGRQAAPQQQVQRAAKPTSDGAAFRAYAAKRGMAVHRATRVKGQKGLVAVEMANGEIGYFARVNDPMTGERFDRVKTDFGTDAIGDGTGRGLRSVTRSGNLRVHAEKGGVVDNKILSIRALRTGIGRLFRADGATRPVATEASIREAAYFESLRDPGATAEENWGRAEANQRARAAATR